MKTLSHLRSAGFRRRNAPSCTCCSSRLRFFANSIGSKPHSSRYWLYSQIARHEFTGEDAFLESKFASIVGRQAPVCGA